ncbi:DnaD domain protein [Macrococcoides caseolyticum]|uniref:replication initiation and membrane attachment family protein n=1 Tax=Macrococcoides caseolyticum TaxID=69966 RepID=UPI001C6054D2|nr:DnaD domain protein [Macrococcus caseolyticus]MDJ1108652.1 DnaD domain protein [Macrococcus caseolyticus]QYA39461.1 DnaD domain protein [Macrococcus caseolyticus]
MERYFTELNGTDEFIVISNYVATQVTEDVLTTLYTPLIGVECIGVYQFMRQFLTGYNQTSDVINHYVILSELKMNLAHFEVIRKRLEAIGLLKTYMRIEDNQKFVYKLIAPVMPSQFFNDPMLSVFLFQQVGKPRYQQLKSRFCNETLNLDGYQDVSSKYMDVFGTPKSPEKAIFEGNEYLVKQHESFGIPVHQHTFDFDLLEMLLAQNLITKSQLPKATRNLIVQLATLYDIAAHDMRGIILKSLTSDQQISHEDLRKNARDFYQIEHDGQLPQLTPQQVRDDTPETKLTWFELMDTTSPIDMLTSFSKSEPTIKQKRMIESILEREQLPFGVMNILLQYVMFTNDMKLPQSYIEEIASNWKKQKLSNSEAAYKYVKSFEQKKQTQLNKKVKNYKNNNTVQRELTPKWLLEEQQPAVKEDTDNIDLEKERQKLLEELNQSWEEDK